MLRGRIVKIVNCHSGWNVEWTNGVGRNVTWSVCGLTLRQGTSGTPPPGQAVREEVPRNAPGPCPAHNVYEHRGWAQIG
jgi:hypothetical protein